MPTLSQAASSPKMTPQNRLSTLSAGEYAAGLRDAMDIVQYLAEFELTLADLEPQQVAMFVAARNSAKLVKDLEIPAAFLSRRDEAEGLREKEAEIPRTQTAYCSDFIRMHVPENEMSVGQIRGVQDLPLEVGDVDVVVINQPDRAHARSGKVEGGRRAEAACSDNEDPSI